LPGFHEFLGRWGILKGGFREKGRVTGNLAPNLFQFNNHISSDSGRGAEVMDRQFPHTLAARVGDGD